MSINSRVLALFALVAVSLMVLPSLTRAADLVQVCVACHGENGISPSPAWPNLAGQKHGYLVNQIKAFRDGQRTNALMSPAVQGLSDERIEKLAAHYAAMPVPERSVEEVNALGRHVRARCISCHGRDGITVNTEWPNLTGQKTEYLKQQLLQYRSGARKHLLMQVIASELTDEEIAAVAEYFGRR